MRVAIVQMCSTDDVVANLEAAAQGIACAAQRAAEVVALPEAFAFLQREGLPVPCAQSVDGEIVGALRGWAAEHGVWLLGGSFPEAIANDARIYNTSVLIDPQGSIAGLYRKIHLFDVDLEGAGGRYRESERTAAGDAVVAVETPFGGLFGLSVCYDLRFPELYRALVDRGARWLFVPSAFTRETGKDHWEVLLRARAIENQAYVIAPAQCGVHSPERASHGRSLIIDPWGVVVAQAADEPTVIVADCPSERVDRVRSQVPSLRNRRL